MDNVAENFAEIKGGLDVMQLSRCEGKPAILVGAGPSIIKHKHLNLLSREKWSHIVIATDRMLVPCLKNGIIPQYVASVDGTVDIQKFYDSKLVDENAHNIKGVFNITVHPNTVKRFKGEKYWFTSLIDNPLTENKRLNTKSVTMLLHFLTKKFMMVTLGNVGGAAWNLACILGCTPIILVGYDFSYSNLNPKKTPFWPHYLQMTKGNKKKAARFFHIETNPVYNTKYLIEPIFMTYLELFKKYLEMSKKSGLRTVNASEGGALHGDWIENMPFEEALNQFGEK